MLPIKKSGLADNFPAFSDPQKQVYCISLEFKKIKINQLFYEKSNN
ncbi:uncharacterized protein METZ01_LOCUS106951 [marine metagenome]|uniref:Uncharacterized protein n=1 Tax=marine metagenome TaxID=408172 RepID=A0A381WQ61_9ZZZZ